MSKERRRPPVSRRKIKVELPPSDLPAIERWKTLGTNTIYTSRIVEVEVHEREHTARGRHEFFVLRFPDWINIIPLTRDKRVVMVRQFRHGTEEFTLEIPGGTIDPDDPNPRHAARREMIEESGYDSKRITLLGRVHPNPAIQGNYCHTFLARDAHRVSTPTFDTTEECEVVTVPLADIPRLIATRHITHALVIAAFSFLHVYNPPRR